MFLDASAMVAVLLREPEAAGLLETMEATCAKVSKLPCGPKRPQTSGGPRIGVWSSSPQKFPIYGCRERLRFT